MGLYQMVQTIYSKFVGSNGYQNTSYATYIANDRYGDILINDGGHASFVVSGNFSNSNTSATLTITMINASKKIIFKGKRLGGNSNTITLYKNDVQIYQYSSAEGSFVCDDLESGDILKLTIGGGNILGNYIFGFNM